MKAPLPVWLLAAIAAPVLSTAARADDGADVLKKAQKASLDAPAMRMTMDSVDHTKNNALHMVVEIVHPDQFHSRVTTDGKLTSEMVTDGHKAFLRQGDGEFRPLPDNMVQMVRNGVNAASFAGTAETAANVKLAGHEDVNGTPASVYTFQANRMGATETGKIWISDRDNLPLKEEGRTAGESKFGPRTVKVDRDHTVTFNYDPSIKITLPGS